MKILNLKQGMCTMKQKIIALLAIVVVSAGLVSATANATSPTTAVTGVVTENFTAVPNANVTALCKGHTQADVADAQGSYLVLFPSADCPFGSTVKVTASYGGHGGASSGTVNGVTTKLNLAIVNISIPEYGMIGGAIAGSAGIGMIIYSRRRKVSDQQV